ncbi:SPOR domain-containing protein [Shewanella algae]|uniref:SPOR domain-containing protein n=1 Tax=Shewanella algae TaxID=38313 RepID=UPI001AACF8AC|nr:SPOR domain-containing protein [Shewanella algae]MBO2585123.1 SPOR domain-containing protein [Shewanella algae]MBO2656711.1 SPOR domain-containing protein [Shewanella algae]QTE91273.1 SPOR domain-containing protein [Shewanella algae]
MGRDYANSKPKPRKPAKRSARKQPQPRQGFPVLLLVVVVAVVAGFGYFLWSLKSSAPEAEVAQPQPQTKPVPQKKDPNALPPKPKEEWTYLKELENKQVEVDLPEESNKPSRPYQMQCGSFRVQSQADEMKAVIAFQGLEAQVRKVQGTSGVWYKVVLGPYDSKRDAERQRHVLQRAGLNGCMIWFWED